jgi:hypothetical protein
LIHFITDFCTWEKVNSKALIPKKVISKAWMIQYPHTVLGMSTTILRLVMLQEHIISKELLEIVLEICTTAALGRLL